MSGEAGLALMARAGVVDRDEPRAAETRGQDLLVLGAERLEFSHQQPHHLTLGDHHAGAVQQRQNPLAGHLSLKMQHQHQAMQMRAVTAKDAGVQRRDQGLPVGRLPAFAPIERHRGIENEVLNDDLLVALAARSRRRRDRHDDGLVDLQLVQVAAAPARRALVLCLARRGVRWIRRLLHSRGLLRRTRRQFLVTRQFVLDRLMLDLELRQRPQHLLVFRPKPRKLADQNTHRADQVRMRKSFERISGVRRHPQLRITLLEPWDSLRAKKLPTPAQTEFPTRPPPLPGNLPR